MSIIGNLLVRTLAILITTYLVPGVRIDSFFTAIVAACVLGLLNMVLRPILVLFTLPINIMTLGLFTLVINAFMILLASKLVYGFYINSFLTAVIFSLLLWLINSFLNSLTK